MSIPLRFPFHHYTNHLGEYIVDLSYRPTAVVVVVVVRGGIKKGIVSGLVGASGNLGGIVFTIIFRYEGLKYERAFWIIGVVTIAVNVLVFRIRPIPRH